MKTNLVTTINGVDIITISEDNTQHVPLKPICKAIGIDMVSQLCHTMEDEILNSELSLKKIKDENGDEHETSTLPLMYILGWLFTLNPESVLPTAAPDAWKHRMTCYNAFADYIRGDEQLLADSLRHIDNLLDDDDDDDFDDDEL